MKSNSLNIKKKANTQRMVGVMARITPELKMMVDRKISKEDITLQALIEALLKAYVTGEIR